MKLNCVVVDDSSIQRTIIAKLVNNHPGLHLIGDFSNAIEAKSCISLNNIDLIFLDIEMPVINGFDFLDGLKSKPQIIFITSKAEYALKAFDYDAADYLQKPIAVDRFNASVKRAIDMHLLKKEVKEEEGEHIFIKSNLKKLKIFTAKIKWIEAFSMAIWSSIRASSMYKTSRCSRYLPPPQVLHEDRCAVAEPASVFHPPSGRSRNRARA